MQDTTKPFVDMAARDTLRQQFLHKQNLQNEDIQPLASDASFRRYFRLVDKNMLVMDSPPELYPTIVFDKVAGLLDRLQRARLAKIFARDHKNGFMLLEDLGKDSLTQLLKIAPQREEELYGKVVESLFQTQMAWRNNYGKFKNILGNYDDAALLREAALLPQWYLPSENNITPDAEAIDKFLSLLRFIHHRLSTRHASPCAVFVHRDFHVDNLLLVGDDIAWLDFQDGLVGHPTYDIMSLLEDARRDVSQDCKQKLWQWFVGAWQQRYPAKKKLVDDFARWFYFLGLTRHAKVLGIFVRLEQRDGKTGYRQHLPRVLRLLQGSMAGLVAATKEDNNDDGESTRHGAGKESMVGAVKKLQDLLQQWGLL